MEIGALLYQAERCPSMSQKMDLYCAAVKKCKFYGFYEKEAMIHCIMANLNLIYNTDPNAALENANNAICVFPQYGEVSFYIQVTCLEAKLVVWWSKINNREERVFITLQQLLAVANTVKKITATISDSWLSNSNDLHNQMYVCHHSNCTRLQGVTGPLHHVLFFGGSLGRRRQQLLLLFGCVPCNYLVHYSQEVKIQWTLTNPDQRSFRLMKVSD